jgi:hypothetical protein
MTQNATPENPPVPAQKDDAALQALQSVAVAQMVVNQGHLDIAADLPVVPFTETGIRPLSSVDTVRLYNITRVIYDRREDSLNNLLNVYAALGHDYGLGLIIRSDTEQTSLYLAVRAYSQARSAHDGGQILTKAIEGHFPGTDIKLLGNDETHNILGFRKKDEKEEYLPGLRRYSRHGNLGISAAVAVPSLKDDEKIAFTQGIERLIDAMEGKEYTAIIMAEPFSKHDVLIAQRGYEEMLSCLSAFGKQQITVSQNHTDTVSHALTASMSTSFMSSLSKTQTHSLSEARTESQSTSHRVSDSHTNTATWNFNMGGAISMVGGAIGGFADGKIGAVLGMQLGGAIGGLLPSLSRSSSKTSGSDDTVTNGDSETVASTDTNGMAETDATTDQTSVSNAKAASQTMSSGINSVFDLRNVPVERLMEKLEAHLERIDQIRAFGAWTAGAYFLSSEAETASTAASIYLGALRGVNSDLGNAAIVRWNNKNSDNRAAVLDNLAELAIPKLILAKRLEEAFSVVPANIISSKELALMMNFPRRSIGGITVLDGVSFGREKKLLHTVVADNSKAEIMLGTVHHLFKDRHGDVTLNRDDLSRHALVTGTTGVGKSTTIKHILWQLHEQKIPFLVLEPAKSEYSELGSLDSSKNPVHIFQVGRAADNCLRLNPLVFPQNGAITLMEHIDRVCALFNAAFPMYAAMPQILEEAVVRAYERHGWDIMTSRFVGKKAAPVFPTLRDIAAEIEDIVTSAGYGGESRSTYIGALKTRIQSLMRGSLGLTFGASQNEETSPAMLFDTPCVVNLASLGSPEKKAIVMGMLLIRLEEYRIDTGVPHDARLRHLMVVEEAHNLLKNTGDASNMEIANPRGQAIEYFANLIAEMRAYGQGFLIADQSVSVLDASVLRNTNTKISFCAPFDADRKILGGALSLDELQQQAMAKLESYTALVKQNDWADAVLCKMKNFSFVKTENKQKALITTENDIYLSTAIECAVSHLKHKIHNLDIRNITDILLWMKRNKNMNGKDYDAWKAILKQKAEYISEKQIGKALYAFPEIVCIVRQALQCTSTAEGMLSRLYLELSRMAGFADEDLPLANLLVRSLLLAGDGDKQKIGHALHLIESKLEEDK